MNIFKEKSTRRARKIPEDLVLKPEVEVYIYFGGGIVRSVKLNEVQDVLKKERSNITLINVLPADSFKKEHIPHSINIPADNSDFVKKVEEHVIDQNTPIIVYCSGPACPLSKEAATLLEQKGFTNVMHFPGGMEEWRNAKQKGKLKV